VWNWLEHYGMVREFQADLIIDRAIIEADTLRIETEVTNDPVEGKTTKTADKVERSKLIVQRLLKRAAQLAPKKYGEKVGAEHSGSMVTGLAESIAQARKRSGLTEGE
jgi:methylphosphotriester-DNA--protein-cysteine methyltransferase